MVTDSFGLRRLEFFEYIGYDIKNMRVYAKTIELKSKTKDNVIFTLNEYLLKQPLKIIEDMAIEYSEKTRTLIIKAENLGEGYSKVFSLSGVRFNIVVKNDLVILKVY